MNKLDELIQELCPNGVEYKPVKEVYHRLRGTPITAAKMKEIERADGDVRIFAGGKTVIDAYEEDIPKANITRVPAVLVQSRGVIDAVYYEKPFTFKNEMWAYTHENKTAVKFLYYVLKNNMGKFRDAALGMGSLPQISLKVTEDFEIPVPPLPIQQEIVRILDAFTELTAELTARKKQYEHYREELLETSTNAVQMNFGDIFDFQNGFAFKSGLFKETGKAILRIANIQDNQVSTDNLVYFDEIDYKENLSSYIVKQGDIVVAMSGATTGKIGVSTTTSNYYLNQRVGKFIPKENVVLNRYLYHLLMRKSGEIYAIDSRARTNRLNSRSL